MGTPIHNDGSHNLEPISFKTQAFKSGDDLSFKTADDLAGIDNPLTAHTEPPKVEKSFKATRGFIKETKGIWNAVKKFFKGVSAEIQRAREGKVLVEDSLSMAKRIEQQHVQYSTTLSISPDLFSPKGITPSLFESKTKIWESTLKPHLDSQSFLEFKPLTMHGDFVATPYGFKNGQLVPRYVVPTGLKLPDLENIHITQTGENQGVLRTAVVNSKARADQFALAIEKMTTNSRNQVRVVSHQLNSYENGENAFVKNQHKQMARLAVDKNIQIAHINTPTNRFYNYTRLFEGTFLEPVVNFFLPGEKKSHKQNVEGMAQYAAWVASDIGLHSDSANFQNLSQEIQAKYKDILIIQEKLKTNPPDAKELKLQKHELHNQIRELRATTRQALIDFKQSLANRPDSFKAQLLLKLIDSQLRINPLSRAQEVLMIKLLNKELGVISATNCKSGLDRTGFAHAVEMAVYQLYKSGKYTSQQIEELVLNWDEISSNHFTPGKAKSDILNEMQNYVLMNLIDVGIPITQRSTGLVGLKWHSGRTAQLVPLEFIPEKVKRGDVDVKLVNYENGKPTGLTDLGHRLLTKLQKMRGA